MAAAARLPECARLSAVAGVGPDWESPTSWQTVPVIEAIFFDGDQTLWDFETLMRRALARTLAELRALRPGDATSGLNVEDMIFDRTVVAAELAGTGVTLEAVRQAAFARTLERTGKPDPALASHLNERYLHWRFIDVPLYPDVLPALALLGERYRLGLLSNGNGYPERSGLAGVFSTVVFSQQHGIEKPDRRLFNIAAAEVGLRADQLVMVGDSLRNDAQGACDAGWQGVWLNRDQQAPTELSATHAITSLEHLPALLERLT